MEDFGDSGFHTTNIGTCTLDFFAQYADNSASKRVKDRPKEETCRILKGFG